MKSIFRLLNWFRSENGSSNASLFLFAGIASELALLIDILCIIIATGGLEYGFDPFGAGCLTGAGCLVLMVLCGVLLCREEQMTCYIVSAVFAVVLAAAMVVFRANVLECCKQILSSVKLLDTDFTSPIAVDSTRN